MRGLDHYRESAKDTENEQPEGQEDNRGNVVTWKPSAECFKKAGDIKSKMKTKN